MAGAAVRLTLDVSLQRYAEDLLDQACRPRPTGTAPAAIGGAIVVMDVASGELLATASAPRFDPQWFASGDAQSLSRLFAARASPVGRPAHANGASARLGLQDSDGRCAGRIRRLRPGGRIRLPGLPARAGPAALPDLSATGNRSRRRDAGRRPGPKLQCLLLPSRQPVGSRAAGVSGPGGSALAGPRASSCPANPRAIYLTLRRTRRVQSAWPPLRPWPLARER